MNDAAARTVADKSRAVVSTLNGVAPDIVDSLGTVIDATGKRGKKVKKVAAKRLRKELKQGRRQLRSATTRVRNPRSTRAVPAAAAAVAVVGGLAIVLKRKAKAVAPVEPASGMGSAIDPEAVMAKPGQL